MQKIEYSCKRKKDFVTFFAIAMFSAICVFELYLIIVLPVQLKQQDAMVHQVKRQEVLTLTETLRRKTERVKPRTVLQECEVKLVVDSLDIITRYIRVNINNLSIPQIDEVHGLLNRFHIIADGWSKEVYQISEKDFDISPILKNIEDRFENQ